MIRILLISVESECLESEETESGGVSLANGNYRHQQQSDNFIFQNDMYNTCADSSCEGDSGQKFPLDNVYDELGETGY